MSCFKGCGVNTVGDADDTPEPISKAEVLHSKTGVTSKNGGVGYFRRELAVCKTCRSGWEA